MEDVFDEAQARAFDRKRRSQSLSRDSSFMNSNIGRDSARSKMRRSILEMNEDMKHDREALFGAGEDQMTRLRRKHPFMLPVEAEVTLPHESSIWPHNRKHFDLRSSYDAMVDFVGITEKSQN